jgi:hypothetical protein
MFKNYAFDVIILLTLYLLSLRFFSVTLTSFHYLTFRVILKRALSSPSESCRLYATRFMLVLIRSRLPGLHRWATELLVDQLGDTKSSISLAAANILSEACDDPVLIFCINPFISLNIITALSCFIFDYVRWS